MTLSLSSAVLSFNAASPARFLLSQLPFCAVLSTSCILLKKNYPQTKWCNVEKETPKDNAPIVKKHHIKTTFEHHYVRRKMVGQ